VVLVLLDRVTVVLVDKVLVTWMSPRHTRPSRWSSGLPVPVSRSQRFVTVRNAARCTSEQPRAGWGR
jgi:hypothetical protein